MSRLFRILFLLILSSLILCKPLENESINDTYNNTNVIDYNRRLSKRIDVSIYLSSIGNYFKKSKDVKHNVSYSKKKNLDIYYSKNDNTKKPVVIFIYGGTWYLGEKSFYTKLGDFLRDNGFVTVIPNYAQFPYGTLNDMTYDISNAINWVYNNIGSYGGDNQNMILLGHSSGAHLAALTLFKSSLGVISQGSKPSNVLPIFQRVVLLNGPFDFDALSDIAKKTGNVPEHSKFEAFLSALLGSRISCPTDILKNFPDKSIKNLGSKRFNILHSVDDDVIPLVSSSGLMDQIHRASDIPAIVYHAHGFTHCGITEGVMKGDGYAQYVLKDLLTNSL